RFPAQSLHNPIRLTKVRAVPTGRGEMDLPYAAPVTRRRVVLLDSHPLWLEVLEQTIGRVAMEVVGAATSPEEALALVSEQQTDLLLAEIYEPASPVDGILCLHDAKERCPSIRMV